MAQPNWITPAGSIGSYPATFAMTFQLSATAVLPATSITYALISGSLSTGLSLSSSGAITGTPQLVTSDTTTTFVIRVTDDLGSLRDRTFSMTVSGVSSPELTTPAGSILSTLDSIWIEEPITYSNPVETNEVSIRVFQGQLPPGLEINQYGLIRGYASPPVINVNLGSVVTYATATETNIISCFSTLGFTVGRPVVFTGTPLGGIVAGQTYYVRSIIDVYSFTISSSSEGTIFELTNDTGNMTVTLPDITVGQPTVRTYSFTLKLDSLLGSDVQSYSITVINQNAPVSAGGPNYPENTRPPTIYNTQPPTYNITEDTPYYGYYVLPPDSEVEIPGMTYNPEDYAFIGKISSDNIFSFKIIGHDFDSNLLGYTFADLPLGITGDATTGWITGNPVIENNTISEFSFSAKVYKAGNPGIETPFYNFSFIITNDLDGNIVWITPTNLGEIENSSVSTLSVIAESDVSLEYRLISGSLPPNLTLLSNGELSGAVAYQPTDTLLEATDTSTFTFTIQAFSTLFPVVQSSREFTLTVVQEYTQPTDTLYIKCTPSIQDRNLLSSLLTNDSLIPSNYLYRPEDSNFGKATNVTYVHAYGIYADQLDEYVAAIQDKNHYWRNITLGEIKTAVAKNSQGQIIYEVVYSSVIDNLINPSGISITKEITWPRLINLNPVGQADILYPNSLPNMREQVGKVLGQEYNFRLYPEWMTSQQANGSTLGFTPAWVIAYCQPGETTLNGQLVTYGEYIKYQIENNWQTSLGDVIKLNQINFKIDRFSVDKSLTYNYDNNLSPATWTALPSATPTPNPKDSQDFYVLFPRETILPDETQY